MRLLIALAILFPALALAEGPSPGEQALMAKLGNEINSGLQCSASLIVAQTKIKELEERIKALEGR